jgi:hypothetical protein
VGAEQGKDVHGMKDKDFTPEFMQKVRELIIPPKLFSFVKVWYK